MMYAVVQTVLGRIPATKLGKVHSHEHLVAHATPELVGRNEDFALNNTARILPDIAEFQQAGGGAIIEMTTIDYGRDPAALRQLSKETGVHIIATTGFNKGTYCRPFTENKDIDEIAAWMEKEVTLGIDDTTIQAGLIKFGTSLNEICPWEEIAGRAAARTHRRTGAPVITHTEAGTMAEAQLDLLAEEGVAPQNVILCHLDRNPDKALHTRLAERGAFISYDQIPKPKYQTEGPAIQNIIHLANNNLHTQVLVSGDYSRRSYFKGWGGGPGLGYILTVFSEKLRAELEKHGLDATRVLEDIFINNPQRAFAMRKLELVGGVMNE